MPSISADLKIDILTAWHLSTGREGGAYADSLVNKDSLGLPVLNGKSIKGLLRAACKESLKHQWLEGIGTQELEQLFGKEGTGLNDQGCIEVSSATLSEGEKQYFVENSDAIKYLYRIDYSTAIDSKTGTAKDSSLRSMESVVPMILGASISFNSNDAKNNALFFDWIKASLPLITAVGAKRRRGYGEAILTITRRDK